MRFGVEYMTRDHGASHSLYMTVPLNGRAVHHAVTLYIKDDASDEERAAEINRGYVGLLNWLVCKLEAEAVCHVASERTVSPTSAH